VVEWKSSLESLVKIVKSLKILVNKDIFFD
jgi:hypothetical protein